jgi:hypothetical protein
MFPVWGVFGHISYLFPPDNGGNQKGGCYSSKMFARAFGQKPQTTMIIRLKKIDCREDLIRSIR